MTILIFLLALGAAARITRLLVDDLLLNPMHDAIQKRTWRPIDGTKPGDADFAGYEAAKGWKWLGDLLGCSWCTGVWVTAPVFVTAAAWGTESWWTWTAGALTAMYLIGVAAEVVDRVHGE
jgi:hypothetical protein